MACASGVAFSLLLAALSPPAPAQRGGQDAAWLDRLDPQDRSCLDRGYAPPDFSVDLLWFNTPPLNDLAREFGNQVLFIALSDEDRSRFLNGLAKHKLSPDGFCYHLAIDPSGQAKGKLGVRGIPHAIVMSGDGVVRWQGHTMGLDSVTPKRIVDANQALHGDTGPPCRRWAGR
jgi:hypothetical protein